MRLALILGVLLLTGCSPTNQPAPREAKDDLGQQYSDTNSQKPYKDPVGISILVEKAEKDLREVSALIEKTPNDPALYIRRMKILTRLSSIERGHGMCCQAKTAPINAVPVTGVLASLTSVENDLLVKPECVKISTKQSETDAFCHSLSINEDLRREYSVERDAYRVLEIDPDNLDLYQTCIEIQETAGLFGGRFNGDFVGCKIDFKKAFQKLLVSRPTRELMTLACLNMDMDSSNKEQLLGYCHQAESSKVVKESVVNISEEVADATIDQIKHACDEQKHLGLLAKLKSLCPDLSDKKDYVCEAANLEEINQDRLQRCRQ